MVGVLWKAEISAGLQSTIVWHYVFLSSYFILCVRFTDSIKIVSAVIKGHLQLKSEST